MWRLSHIPSLSVFFQGALCDHHLCPFDPLSVIPVESLLALSGPWQRITLQIVPIREITSCCQCFDEGSRRFQMPLRRLAKLN